jgi:dihydroxyacetone kinase
MLTAAVSGDVFTSPSTDAVLAAIRAVGGAPGVLLIIKNYTGDRLHFGLAAELARAEGIPVEMVVVADDVALPLAGDRTGRRGLAGTVFVHKVAGAAAAAGLPLSAVKLEAELASEALGTMGVALTPCTVPAAGRAGFDLGGDEIELGLGIHGEAGVERTKLQPVDRLVDTMLARIVADRGLAAGDRVALLANNLGGTPAMEMALVFRRAVTWLAAKGIVVERAWSGPFLTAIEMAGCSLTLMKVDDGRLARLTAPAAAPAWPAEHVGRVVTQPRRFAVAGGAGGAGKAPAQVYRDGEQTAMMRRLLLATAKGWLAAETLLTELDRVVGDGDLGLGLARGARGLERDLASYDLGNPAATLRAVAATLRRATAGSSGALYAVMLLRAAAVFERVGDHGAKTWATALMEGQQAIAEVGGAKPGDRTMLDALAPAAAAFAAAIHGGHTTKAALQVAVEAARAGALATKDMQPRLGRSSYLGNRAIGHVDPGAQAVVVWLEAILSA